MPTNYAQTLKSKRLNGSSQVVVTGKNLTDYNSTGSTNIVRGNTTGEAVVEAIEATIIPVETIDADPVPEWSYNHRIDLTPFSVAQVTRLKELLLTAYYDNELQFITAETGGTFLLHNNPTLVNTMIRSALAQAS